VFDRSLLAFLLAFAASLALTPLMRSVALSAGIVDRPAARKVHTGDVPYMGGIAIAIAAIVGLVTRSDATAHRIGFLAIIAAILGVVGLLDDDRTLPVRPRLFTQFAAAIAAVLVGVRAHPTGVAAYDVVITILFIVAMTNALNLLDNMDGLAGGIAASIGAGVFALAAFGHQDIVAAFAAGICGACLGFLAFNWRPASIFMGDAGALFLGFVLSIAVLEVRPVAAPSGTFAVLCLLMGLPILDTCTVLLARMRHGLSVAQGGRDHLSHRLVALGLSPSMAVAVLIGVQLLLSALGVLAGRGVLRVSFTVAGAVFVCAALSIVCSRAHVYRTPVVGLPRLVRLTFIAAAGFTTLAILAVGVAGLQLRRDVTRARDDVQRAITAMRAGDTARARAEFTDAGVAFRSANHTIHSPLVFGARALPLVAPNVHAADDIITTGVDLASAGERLAGSVDPKRFEVKHGTVPLAEVQHVTTDLEQASQLLRDSRERLAHIDERYLLPLVTHTISQLQDRLRSAQTDADHVTSAAEIVPDVFGGHGTRRYFLAVQNSAELRATGGFIGNWGILTARNGHISLDRFERIDTLNSQTPATAQLNAVSQDYLARYQRFGIANTWQNVNMAPDFPTVGNVIKDLLPQTGEPSIDGVIAVDSSGLAALLRLTGPVHVANWPDPITSDNVVDVTLRDAYARFADRDTRRSFLGDVAHAVWSAATSSTLGSPQHMAEALGEAANDGHLTLWLAQPREEKVASAIGAAGSVPTSSDDSLMVVTQNGAGNKVDYYLHRKVTYDLTLQPAHDGRTAQLHGRVEVQLTNDAPSSGLPREVIGPYDARFQPGENRAFVSVYTPSDFVGATLGGRPVGLESAHESGRHVYSAFVSVPARSTRTLVITLSGQVPLVDGWYRLGILKQPTLRPDNVVVDISVPGRRITNWWGVQPDPQRRRAAMNLLLTSQFTVGVQTRPVDHASILQRLGDAT
jgi:UDP-N-acetylmuramyl pentapeptide phosphotransferase/UDP-N-acetylglucosamine-1-phosphate transferase